ncbi:hypothetical protein DL93DRAFT_2084362, partial [Clavulina sp. PMI_390]
MYTYIGHYRPHRSLALARQEWKALPLEVSISLLVLGMQTGQLIMCLLVSRPLVRDSASESTLD